MLPLPTSVFPLELVSIYMGLFTNPTILNSVVLKFFLESLSNFIVYVSPIFKLESIFKTCESNAISPLFSGNLPSTTTSLFMLLLLFSMNFTKLFKLVTFTSILLDGA